MQIRLPLTALLCLAAHGAIADARFNTGTNPQLPSLGIVIAQANFDSLSASDLRRLEFYSNRATTALQEVVEGTGTQDAASQNRANDHLKSAIARLADAGARSGLSVDQVSEYYTQVVFDQFGQDFMQRVGVLSGGADFGTLFRNLATNPESDSESQFSNLAEAVQNEANTIVLTNPLNSGSVQVVGASVAGPEPLPGANNAERAIVARVIVDQGRWLLVAQQGDRLSEIAAAIYGNPQAYTAIYDANTNVMTGPNTLEVDTVLVLPKP